MIGFYCYAYLKEETAYKVLSGPQITLKNASVKRSSAATRTAYCRLSLLLLLPRRREQNIVQNQPISR